MNYCFFMFFFVLSSSAFSFNTLENRSVEIKEVVDVLENGDPLSTNNSDENAIVFECYYTVKWLYKESPFIKKLDAFA